MKSVLLLASLLLAPPVFATETLQVESCKDAGIDLTSVPEMRSFGNGNMNIFKTDLVEPAAGSIGLAVVVHRGDSLEDMESHCRHISGLSDIDLKTAKSAYDPKTNVLGLKLAGRKMNADGEIKPVTVFVKIDRKADEKNLVKAAVR